jgi:HEAT repeat protein
MRTLTVFFLSMVAAVSGQEPPPTGGVGRGAGRGVMRRGPSEDRRYERAQRALDARKWEEALKAFSEVASTGGSRADGALYWKAYALNKLGRREEAAAALDQLQKAHATSRWLNDAKALEVEIRQASGQPVAPESEQDEELKLIALGGLVHSDPERALPLVEKLLTGAQSPKVKERALFVLAQSGSPRARGILVQAVKGGANPDLQLKAVQYLGMMGSREAGPVFAELYGSAADARLKRAILQALVMSGQKDQVLQIARTEKELELRRAAIHSLGTMGRPTAGDGLISIYAGESDAEIRKAVVHALFLQSNAEALVDIARKESSYELKREIVQRLSRMKSKEAAEYLEELVAK